MLLSACVRYYRVVLLLGESRRETFHATSMFSTAEKNSEQCGVFLGFWKALSSAHTSQDRPFVSSLLAFENIECPASFFVP